MDTKKQKVIKVLKRIGIALSIGFNVLFLIAIIVGSSGIKNKSNNVQVACAESEVIKVDSQVNKKFVSYDDVNYSITFSSYELNNGVFTNFEQCLRDIDERCIESAIYQGETYLTDNNTWNYDFTLQRTRVGFGGTTVGNAVLWFNYDYTNYKFSLVGSNSFDSSLVLNVGSTYLSFYEQIKSSIELDIANIPSQTNINDGIFETLTSGVVAFIGSLSSGITAMTSVFYDSANSQLTTIGLLSVIVVAISLVYFLFRLIIGLIRMRG